MKKCTGRSGGGLEPGSTIKSSSWTAPVSQNLSGGLCSNATQAPSACTRDRPHKNSRAQQSGWVTRPAAWWRLIPYTQTPANKLRRLLAARQQALHTTSAHTECRRRPQRARLPQSSGRRPCSRLEHSSGTLLSTEAAPVLAARTCLGCARCKNSFHACGA